MLYKNLFSIVILFLSGLFYFNFIDPFKLEVVDPVVNEFEKVKAGFEKSEQLLTLNNLRQKKQSLSVQETAILENYIPTHLHSGDLIYRLGNVAVQNRLSVKGIQFSKLEDSTSNQDLDKKLLIDMTLEGKYEDFYLWLSTIEKSNRLVDVVSIRANKNGVGEIISFSVKMYAYGIQID